MLCKDCVVLCCVNIGEPLRPSHSSRQVHRADLDLLIERRADLPMRKSHELCEVEGFRPWLMLMRRLHRE